MSIVLENLTDAELRANLKELGYVYNTDYKAMTPRAELIALIVAKTGGEVKEEVVEDIKLEDIQEISEVVADMEVKGPSDNAELDRMKKMVEAISKKLNIKEEDLDNTTVRKARKFVYRLREYKNMIATGFDKTFGNNGSREYKKASTGQASLECKIFLYNPFTKKTTSETIDQVDFFSTLSKVVEFDDVKIKTTEQEINLGVVTKVNYRPVASALETTGVPFGAVDSGLEVPNLVIVPITTFQFNIGGEYVDVQSEIVNQ